MANARTDPNRLFALFDGMTWPMPFTELEWTLRYGTPTRGQLLRAASILAAYDEIVRSPERKRRYVVRNLRALGDRRPSGEPPQ